MTPGPSIGLRILFMVLGCVSTATVIYTIVTDGLPFRKELLTPWMAATLIDFYINILAIGAWILYKESNWISAIIWIALLVCLGRVFYLPGTVHLLSTFTSYRKLDITTCGYIVLQFLKLSPQESLQDPIYFVLLSKRKKSGMESKSKLSVASTRVLFTVLGCLMLGTLIYTIATDGSPFRKDVLTPWLSATLVDFYINVVALSVWVAYKESNWMSSVIWIILLICFGSISTCAYIVLQLFHLSSEDPVFLVFFSSRSRSENGYEGTLQRDNFTLDQPNENF